jgi:hypothetical protein
MPWIPALALAAWMALAGGVGAASAAMRCEPEDARGVRRCTASLAPELIQRMQVTQQRSQWCWAASLQMIFTRYGYTVPQADIVERLYGGEQDLPIRTGDVPPLVGRDWFGLDGRGFSARILPHAVAQPTLAGHRQVLQALAEEHPLLIVTGRHVVVLVALDFEEVAHGAGLRITGGLVLDPTPGQGIRMLARAEANPALLAQVIVRQRPAHFTSVAELQEPGAPGGGTALARGGADASQDTFNGADRSRGSAVQPR